MSDEQYYEKVTSLKKLVYGEPVNASDFMVELAKGILFPKPEKLPKEG